MSAASEVVSSGRVVGCGSLDGLAVGPRRSSEVPLVWSRFSRDASASSASGDEAAGASGGGSPGVAAESAWYSFARSASKAWRSSWTSFLVAALMPKHKRTASSASSGVASVALLCFATRQARACICKRRRRAAWGAAAFATLSSADRTSFPTRIGAASRTAASPGRASATSARWPRAFSAAEALSAIKGSSVTSSQPMASRLTDRARRDVRAGGATSSPSPSSRRTSAISPRSSAWHRRARAPGSRTPRTTSVPPLARSIRPRQRTGRLPRKVASMSRVPSKAS